MERIAPLARILAEANGIEWQQLSGTGAGGMIVEQDILDYLSRVMSGEAEPPSTPVDAPPPDWTGEDLPGGGMFDAKLLSQAGVDSDIADFVQQSRPAAPAPSSTLSQDDFELDDAQDESLLASPAAPLTPSPFHIPPVAPAAPTFSSGPIPTGPIPVSPGPVNRIPETPMAESSAVSSPASATLPASTLPAPTAPVPTAPAPTTPAAGGLGSLLSRLYQKSDDQPVTPPPAAPEPRPSSFTSGSFTSGSSVGTSSFGAGGFSGGPVTPPAPTSPFGVPPVELRDEAPLADPRQPVMPAPTSPMTAPTIPPVDVEEVDVEEVSVEEARMDEVGTDAVLPERAAPVAEPQDRVPDTFAPSPEEAVADVRPSETVSVPAPVPAAQPEPVIPVPVPATTTPAAPRDAVWFGTYLRRDAQVAQLHDLRGQLSEALEREVPLALLVARAAQRHAAGLGLGSVAMRDMERGLTRQMGGEVGSSVSLRDALTATSEDFEGTPDLLVVDAGALDMDDLHYPDTLTLSVGRVQEGRAALSLQGDVDPEKAARFLASVAQTLEKPVILLV